jgi:hypothetical protein
MSQPPTLNAPVDREAETIPNMVTLPRDVVFDLFFLARLVEPGDRAGPAAAQSAEWPKPAGDTQVPGEQSPDGGQTKATTPVVSSLRVNGWPPRSLLTLYSLIHSAMLTEPFSDHNHERRQVINNGPPAPVLQPLGNKPPIANQTLVIHPLPKGLRIRDLIHSLTAPGGLRQVHFAPLKLQPHVQVAVVTFMDPKGAEGFKKYADKHGFFLSLRADKGPRLVHGDDNSGETLFGMIEGATEHRGVKKIYVIKKHLPEIRVRFWGLDASGRRLDQNGWMYKSVEAELLKWFQLIATLRNENSL